MLDFIPEGFEWVSAVVTGLYGILVAVTLALLVSRNRHPLFTLSWGFAIVFIPIAGLVFYYNIGRGYIKRRKYRSKAREDMARLGSFSRLMFLENNQAQVLAMEGENEKSNLMRLLQKTNRALITRYNHVRVLQNGEQTFSWIMEVMENARHHIHLEYYIITNDKLGQEVADLLIRKAREGLEVRLIYDAFGSWELPKHYVKNLEKAGVEVSAFGPLRFPLYTSNVNYRNHRKILVVDGRYGFTGGINLSERYRSGIPEDDLFWRDTHLFLEGEAVSGLQSTFINDWNYTTGDEIGGEPYFPVYRADNYCLTQVVPSGPDGDWEEILQAYFYAIATGKRRVYISTPYFIPDDSLMMALTTAAMSGTDVRLLLPSQADVPFMRYASLSYAETLLKAGVRIYFYRKGFNHQKVMTVDGQLASVGTANMDLRSFKKNFEISAFIYNKDVAQDLEVTFLKDLEDSEELKLPEFQERPRIRKIGESLVRILTPAF